jgi:hypothetical protein
MNRHPTPRHRSVVLAALVAAGALLVAACGGLALDQEPRLLNTDEVPEGLVTPTSAVDPGPRAGPDTVDADLFLYWVADGVTEETLYACAVPTAAGGSVEERALAVVERLVRLDPVANDYCPVRSTTAVPPELAVLGRRLVVERDGNVLELNLAKGPLSSVEATQQRRAIAQLVFTATGVPGVNAVRFLADGEPIAVPLEDRTADPGQIVRPADFPRLLASTQRLAEALAGLAAPPTTEPPLP